MNKKIIKIGLPIIIIIVSCLIWKYYMSNVPVPYKTDPVRTVPTVITEKSLKLEIPLERDGYGQIQAETTLDIKTETGGSVIYKSSLFEAGRKVSKGDVLFKFDPSSYEAALKSAEAASATAEVNLARIEHSAQVASKEWELWNLGKEEPETPGLLADYRLQLAEARARSAEAIENVKVAKRNLEKTIYTAPFDAEVSESNISLGSVVRAGDTVGKLTGSKLYEVVVPFPASVSVDFRFSLNEKEASNAILTLRDGIGTWNYNGYLAKILPEADEATGMLKAVVRLPLNESNLKGKPKPAIGMNVKVSLQTRDTQERIIIPESALREQSQVWTVVDGKLKMTPVTVHSYRGDKIILLDGLKGGEDLVVSRLRGAVDGMDVIARETMTEGDE